MILDEKVLTALEVLTDAAENDFELFRICTLVRDLVAPPKAEQVDDTHQRFNGVTYTNEKSGHFARHNFAHRDVWQYFHGEIPAGYDIHHVDENPANNDISNLVLLTKAEHGAKHSRSRRRPSIASFKEKVYICKTCGKKFQASSHGGYRCYCSEECKRASYRPPEHKVSCKYCGKEFSTVRPSQIFCCNHCRLQYSREKEKKYQKVCPICGKEFRTRTEKSVCCSVNCGNKYRPINRR